MPRANSVREGHDTRHRTAIDNIVAGTEDAARYLLSWDEITDRGNRIRCSMPVPSRQLARRIIYDLFMNDDNVSKINFQSLS